MDLGYTEAAYLFLGTIAVPTLLWRPHLIIYLLIITAMLPFSNFIKFSIGGINIYLKDMLFICYFLCLISVIFSAIIHKVRTIDLASPNKVLLYCVFSFVTLHIFYMFYGIFQGVPLDSAIRRFGIYSGCLYFFLPLLYIKTKEQLRKLLIFTVIVSLLYPAWQLFAFVGCAGKAFVTSSGTIRLAGAAAAPILASALLAILIWRRGINQYILSAIPMVSILLIGHRSAYVATVLSVALLFCWLRDVAKLVIFSYLTALCIPLIVVSLNIIGGYDFGGDIITRLSDTFSTTDQNTLARTYAVRDNIMVFLSKPIFGIGYDHEGLSHILTNKTLVENSLEPHLSVLHPHNFLMRFLSHTGLVGTSLILMIIISILRKNYVLISRGGLFRSQGIFLFCSIMFIIVYSLMNTVFFSNAGSLFWILGGITVLLFEEMLRTEEVRNHIVEKK